MCKRYAPSYKRAFLSATGCDRGFHTYCVQVEDIPEAEWYCPDCAVQRIILEGLSGQTAGECWDAVARSIHFTCDQSAGSDAKCKPQFGVETGSKHVGNGPKMTKTGYLSPLTNQNFPKQTAKSVEKSETDQLSNEPQN